MANGLNSSFSYTGHFPVRKIKELIAPYLETDLVKQKMWSCQETLKTTMNGTKVPTISVSAGLILVALACDDDMKSSHKSFRCTIIISCLYGLFASTIGIWFRIAKQLPGGGNHPASGFLVFSIVCIATSLSMYFSRLQIQYKCFT